MGVLMRRFIALAGAVLVLLSSFHAAEAGRKPIDPYGKRFEGNRRHYEELRLAKLRLLLKLPLLETQEEYSPAKRETDYLRARDLDKQRNIERMRDEFWRQMLEVARESEPVPREMEEYRREPVGRPRPAGKHDGPSGERASRKPPVSNVAPAPANRPPRKPAAASRAPDEDPAVQLRRLRAQDLDAIVGDVIAEFNRTGVPERMGFVTLTEHFLWRYLEDISRPQEAYLLSPGLKERARKEQASDGTDFVRTAVDTVLMELLLLAGHVSEAVRLYQQGVAEPFPDRQYGALLALVSAGDAEAPKPRWSVLDDRLMAVMKYLKNRTKRHDGSHFEYEDGRGVPTEFIQRGGSSTRLDAHNILELLQNESVADWLSSYPSRRLRRVLRGLAAGQTHASIAQTENCCAKTIQRDLRKFLEALRDGLVEQRQRFTDDFTAFIAARGSKRERDIVAALADGLPRSAIAEQLEVSTKTVQRAIDSMKQMARDAGVTVYETGPVQVIGPLSFE